MCMLRPELTWTISLTWGTPRVTWFTGTRVRVWRKESFLRPRGHGCPWERYEEVGAEYWGRQSGWRVLSYPLQCYTTVSWNCLISVVQWSCPLYPKLVNKSSFYFLKKNFIYPISFNQHNSMRKILISPFNLHNSQRQALLSSSLKRQKTLRPRMVM